jgi:hypothetical protein
MLSFFLGVKLQLFFELTMKIDIKMCGKV